MKNVSVLTGALLSHAESLLRMGLSVPEVIEGYEQACEEAVKILPGFYQILNTKILI